MLTVSPWYSQIIPSYGWYKTALRTYEASLLRSNIGIFDDFRNCNLECLDGCEILHVLNRFSFSLASIIHFYHLVRLLQLYYFAHKRLWYEKFYWSLKNSIWLIVENTSSSVLSYIAGKQFFFIVNLHSRNLYSLSLIKIAMMKLVSDVAPISYDIIL